MCTSRAFRRVRDRVKWGRLFRSVRCAHSAPQTPPFQKPDSTLNNPIQRLDNPDHFRESEDRYRVLAERNPHGIEVIDPTGIITYANPAYQEMLGYTKEELTGKNTVDLS